VSTWLAIAGVAASTFLLRASFIVFADPHRFPRRFRQALTFVPPAVLAAIVVPGLLLVDGTLDLTLANPRWLAGALAILVGARTRNAMAAIASGMVTLWLLQWAMG
jgi:branched-subunit amino acid transport protein